MKAIKIKHFYFIWVIIAPILSVIGQWILDATISQYISDDIISKFFAMNVSLKVLFPICLGVVVFIICLFVYIKNLKKRSPVRLTQTDNQLIQNPIHKIAEEYGEIESIQAYQYYTKDDEHSKYIKTNFICGWANERIEINSILQAYYHFPYSIYKKIKKFSIAYEEYIKAQKSESKIEHKNDFLKQGKELSEILFESLNSISSEDEIAEYHCELYRILLIVLNAINDEPIERILKNTDVENILITKKRTGLLGGIILKDIYIFKNQNSLTKRRIYFTFPYNINKGSNIILIVAMNNDNGEQDDMEDIELSCREIVSRMNDLLVQEKEAV